VKQTITLYEPTQAHRALDATWKQVKGWLICNGGRLVLSVKPETRSNAQNNRLWAMLDDISKQVDWHGRKLTDIEWKHVFTAALKRQDVVPGLDGGFVVLGQSTSAMTVKEMCELQDLMEAFGAQNGVRFSAPEYLGDER
jgi:hypothetical protein